MHSESNIWLTFFWWAVFSSAENLTLMNASRSKAATPPAEALAPPSRFFLAVPRPPLIIICLAFFPVVFLIALSPIFLRGEAFFTAAGFFLDLVFLIPGFVMEIFLAPALAAFLEAAEFGAAMILTSGLFAGQWSTVRDFVQMDNISLIDNIVFVQNFQLVFPSCFKYIPTFSSKKIGRKYRG